MDLFDLLLIVMSSVIAPLSAAAAYWLLEAAGIELRGPRKGFSARRLVRAAQLLTARERAALALAFACVVCLLLLLAPLPAGGRAAVVLPLALVAPGLCVTRRVGIREPLIEVALAFPVSAALWVAAAQAQLYLHAWYPRAGFVVLLLACAASLVPELRRLPSELEDRVAS